MAPRKRNKTELQVALTLCFMISNFILFPGQSSFQYRHNVVNSSTLVVIFSMLVAKKKRKGWRTKAIWILAFPLCACCCIQTWGCNLVIFPAQLRHVEDGLHPVRSLFTTSRKLMVQLHLLEKSGDLTLPPNVLCSLMLPIVYKFWIQHFFRKKKLRTLEAGLGIFKVRVNGGYASLASVAASIDKQFAPG